jgi:hypothetical protein
MSIMKSGSRLPFLFLTLFLFGAGMSSPASASEKLVRVVRGAPTNSVTSNPARTNAPPKVKLPPAPEDVTDLPFSETYQLPVGPAGLVFTEKVRALEGRKVRMLGYMVKQSQPMPWTLLLSSVPMTLHESHYGFAEDLPPQMVHAFTERTTTPILPHTPGLMLLTGRLELGAREEPDGRVSHVRLFVDPPTPGQRKALATLASKPARPATNLTEAAARPTRP